MNKTFLTSMVILPILTMFAGCGSDGGYYSNQYNPNEVHVYHHDVSNPWKEQAEAMQNFCDNTDEVGDSFVRGAHKMNKDNMNTFGTINDTYRQQRR